MADLVANNPNVKCSTFLQIAFKNAILQKVVKELIPKTYLDLEKLIISMSGAL